VRLPPYLLALTILAVPPAAAQTIEPRKIAGPNDLRPGEGALLLSIRHQTPVAQTMHVRFVAVDDERRELKFERKVGMGGRTRMLARQVFVYAVPAGRWRLASHLAGCDERIRPGEECTLTVAGHDFTLPSGTYPADWFVVDVPAGGATDAGEINLELPRETVFGVTASREEIQSRTRALRFKARALPAAETTALAPFRSLPGGSVTVAPAGRSETMCERPAKELNLPYNPFTC
jgi:hypothetical protein